MITMENKGIEGFAEEIPKESSLEYYFDQEREVNLFSRFLLTNIRQNFLENIYRIIPGINRYS